MERRPSGQEALRQENLRCDEKQRRQDGDRPEKGRRPHERPLPAARIPCIPRLSFQQQGRRGGKQRHAEQDARQPHPRLFHEHADLHELRQQHKRDLPYPRLSSPNEQCEQHTADGKRVLSGTPEMRAAQYKSQRGRGKAQNRTHDAHGRLLSSGIPHLIRCGMICRDRRHVSRLSPQALGLQRAIFLDINAFSQKHPVAGAPPFPRPLRPLTNVIRNGLFLPAALSTGK